MSTLNLIQVASSSHTRAGRNLSRFRECCEGSPNSIRCCWRHAHLGATLQNIGELQGRACHSAAKFRSDCLLSTSLRILHKPLQSETSHGKSRPSAHLSPPPL